MNRKRPIMKTPPACLAALLALPLAGQSPPFVEGPAFGGTTMFSGAFTPVGTVRPGKGSFLAFGYTQGDVGADKFFSRLDDLSGGSADAPEAMLKLVGGPWGYRMKAYGMAIFHRDVTLAVSREEKTSLYALANDEAWGGATDFDVRRAVAERLSVTYSGTYEKFYYGSTLRIERWHLGRHISTIDPFPVQGDPYDAKALLDYSETPDSTLTYAVDAFLGYELARGLRLGVQADRLTARSFGDVEEKTQFKAGAQVDIGTMAQLTVETDINETARLPFPAKQKISSASLKFKAHSAITFAVGATQTAIGGHKANRFGLTAWFTGKKYHVGVGFHLGGDQVPFAVAGRIY